MIRYLFFCLSALILFSSTGYAEDKNDPYRTLYYLSDYKCIIVSTTDPRLNLASSQAKVYSGPEKNAKEVGEAVTISLENIRVPIINNRQAILRPNGSTGWVDMKYLYPYLKPCYPVLMANGIHGFGPIPPKKQKHD